MKLRVLFLAYYLPPNSAVGSFRAAKFAKFLGQRDDIEIDFLSVASKYYANCSTDHAITESPNINVYRTNWMAPIPKLREEGLRWLPPALIKAFSLQRKRKYDCVVITGNPFFQFCLGPVLKKFFRVPYVLDFRDPWYLSPYRNIQETAGFYRSMIRRAEGWSVRNASRILNVTEDATRLFRDHYQEIPSNCFVTIENGFDRADANVEPVTFPQKHVLVYAGKFSTFRDPKPLFQGIAKVAARRNWQASDFVFLHVGAEEPHVRSAAQEFNVEHHYQNTGYVSYREALGSIRGATACCLVAGGHPYEPTTKVFDYLAFEKPILAIAPNEGFLGDVLGNAPAAFLTEAKPEAIANSLEATLTASNQPVDFGNLLERFSRERQAEQLYEVLKTTVLEHRGEAPVLSESDITRSESDDRGGRGEADRVPPRDPHANPGRGSAPHGEPTREVVRSAG